ncbi:MAG: ABC transporter ATP-binding protein [Methanobacteriota archaeon]|nr:MAG: ABC transporter ATP-binding protein [Euryarchaeota archaeon]
MSIHSDAEKELPKGHFGYSDQELYKFMFDYAKPYRREILVTIFYMILYSAFTVVAPLLILRAVDTFKGEPIETLFGWSIADRYLAEPAISFLENLFPTIDKLWFQVGLLAFSYLFTQLMVFLTTYKQRSLIGSVGLKATNQLRYDLFVHLQELDMTYHDKNEVGRIMSRVTSDVAAVWEFIGGSVVQNVVNIITIIAVLTIVFQLDPQLALVSLMMMVPVFFLGRRARHYSRPRRKEARRRNSILMASLAESIAGIKVTKGLSREDVNIEIFRAINDERRRAQLRAVDVNAVFFPSMMYFSSIAVATLFFVGGLRVISGAITLGVLIAYINYNSILFRPVVILGNFYEQLQDALTGAERVKALLETPTKVPWNLNAPQLPHIRGNVTFNDITFEYLEDQPVYEDFNLKVEAGQKVAIVGQTGAGKTTIINILSRLYPIKKGELLLDNYNVLHYSLPSIREQVVAIPQDFFLFSTSIRENLKLGNPRASEEEMWKALELVGMREFVEQMENGLDTPLQERGGRLSIGQRQLIVFAAVLLADPRIIILDEATSNIDVFTEMKIQRSMKEILKGRTAFVIAHRLSTVRDADKIIVIDHGRIVEEGTHEELIEKQGHYFKLVSNQVTLANLETQHN